MDDIVRQTDCKKCIYYCRQGFCKKKRIYFGEDTLTLCTEHEC